MATVHPSRVVALAFLLFGLADTASADMPMALFFAQSRASLGWASLVALAIETLAIKWIFSLSWWKAPLAAVVVNLATLMVGMDAYPFLTALLYRSLLVDPGTLGDLMGSLVWISAIDTVIELGLLALVFRVVVRWKGALLFLLANFLSAGILFEVFVWTAQMSAEG